MTELITSDKWYSDRKSNKADEARRIIETTAKLIKCSIRDDLNKQKKTYPSSEEVSSKRIPETLRAFLRCLIKSDLKIESFGHCIAKCVSPRLLMHPILFTLAIELDQVFGSRWLINQLHEFDFCELYDEVLKFKQAVVTNGSIDDLLQNDEGFTTFVDDNVDYNTATLDDRGTFHGLSVIAVIMKKEQR